MNAHPAADLFPLMNGVDLMNLVEDIRAHGLLEPIVLFDGLVLDGRNRLRACEIAEVEPRYVDVDLGALSPTEYVLSHNLHRRHLTVAQRAALALDVLPRLEEEARERQALAGGSHPGALPPEMEEAKGEATEKAAELVGVGRSTVAAAKAIQKRDETGEVVDAMRAGEMNVAQAARAVGFEKLAQGSGGVPLDDGMKDSRGRVMPVHYGKGDKWHEATAPLLRYLAAQEKRGMTFPHCNPREAAKRIEVIDEITALLAQARADLEPRSHRAVLSV